MDLQHNGTVVNSRTTRIYAFARWPKESTCSIPRKASSMKRSIRTRNQLETLSWRQSLVVEVLLRSDNQRGNEILADPSRVARL